MYTVAFKLDKSKLYFLLFAALGFVAVGCWMLFGDIDTTRTAKLRPALVKPVGILCILFFGACFYFIVKKIMDKTPGLIIDNRGITENSNAVSIGFIPWRDISGIKPMKVLNQRSVLVTVTNPEEYINRQHNAFGRKGLSTNWKMFGSPISITANSLTCNYKELVAALEKGFEIYKGARQPV